MCIRDRGSAARDAALGIELAESLSEREDDVSGGRKAELTVPIEPAPLRMKIQRDAARRAFRCKQVRTARDDETEPRDVYKRQLHRKTSTNARTGARLPKSTMVPAQSKITARTGPVTVRMFDPPS